MSESLISVKQVGSILEVNINRADFRNALNPELIKSLTEIFLKASSQTDLRGVFLTGSGSAFCAGADINYMQSIAKLSAEENRADARRLFAMFDSVYRCTKPVVTFVQGACFGGGLGLVACSDFVIAEPEAQFCFSEVKLGLAPSVISHFIFEQGLVPLLRPEMLTARVFSAAEAQNKSLVHQIASQSGWETPKTSWRKQMQSLAPLAFAKNKVWLQQMNELSNVDREKNASNLLQTCVQALKDKRVLIVF